jgi:hypothetical protein
MGYIFLGHGDLDVDPSVTSPEMEWVAIPQGTTIQFYADTGQGLCYNSKNLDVWSQLPKHLNPVDSSNVTYNLNLSNAKELWDEELKNNPDFNGNTLIRAGVDGVPDPIRMCTGTRETCPTDPRQVTAGATHKCDGILAKYTGELYWLACTTLYSESEAQKAIVDAARGDSPENVVLGQDPDKEQDMSNPLPPKERKLTRDQLDMSVVDNWNERILKDLAEGTSKGFYQLGDLVIVDLGDPAAGQPYINWIKVQDGVAKGEVTMTAKGGAFSAGTLTASGGGDKGAFEGAIGRISKKKVKYG